ncbi:MAG: helix-turn-helix domain-containing protein, partial [Methyloprofundus sp.]|nr:helix-turn-helix domain-containing protein [Methyloprofundus sp.]
MSAFSEDQQNIHNDHLPLAINTGKIEALTPTDLELMSDPWEIMIKPLDLNTFYNQKNYLITPSTILYKESYSSSVHLQGLTPDGMLGFTIPLKLGSQSLYWNATFNQQELPASLPGGLDVVIDAGQTHIIVLIQLSLLERMLPKQQATVLKTAASKRQLPITKPAIDSFTQWLLNLLSYAQQHPDIYQHSSVLRSVEEDLLQQLLRVVRLPLQIPAKDSRQKRRQGLDLALEFLREADLSSLSIPEICSKTGVSQRTLEYAFQEHLNMTPIRFIRKLRLHSIRRTLLTSEVSDTSISDTAYQHGIYDMGRFASIYKNYFGELPSQ